MSIYRKSVWFIKGMREYTKSGYSVASKSFNSTDLDVDCTGKSFMITGANSGLGKVTAIEIAKRGKRILQNFMSNAAVTTYAHWPRAVTAACNKQKDEGGTIHMVCRNKERGEEAKEEIKSATGNEHVHLHLLDMSEPRKVVTFAKEFADSGEKLNVLINNAGCMVNTREITEDGLEKNFATNTLGTHLLTVGLLPVLSASEQPRIIIVTSGGMLTQKLDAKDLSFENMKPFDGTMAYAQNKRQQVVLTEQYAKDHSNVHVSCMHPGWADTPAVRMAMPEFYEKMKNRLRTAEEGADTLVWLAVSPAALKHASGLFFQDRQAVSTHLPLARSKTSTVEDKEFMEKMAELTKQFQC